MGQKYAVIVAVEQYQDKSLRSVQFAENDAKEFKAVLSEHGFDQSNVSLLLSASATKTRVESEMRNRTRSLTKDDTFFLFYAGHGFSEAGQNYITCHDTVHADLSLTSISLQVLLKQLSACKCPRIVLFLDSCHSGLEFDPAMRGVLAEMTETEVAAFCAESNYHVAFASCATDEKSYSASALKHGVWSHHLIAAFSGKDKSALERGRFLTSDSLQNYLSLEVPRTIRRTLTGTKTQNPRLWGTMSREFILADLAPLIAKETTLRKSGFNLLKRVSLWGTIAGRVKKLSGFSRFNTVPAAVNSTTNKFVRNIGEPDLRQTAEECFQRLKREFDYKRREIDLDPSGADATIQTPDFTVNFTLHIDQDDPGQYVIDTEVTDIRNASAIETEAFGHCFDGRLDRLVFEVDARIPVQDVIDKCEERGLTVDYESGANHCTLTLDEIPVSIKLESQTLTLTDHRGKKVSDLLDAFRQLPKKLGDNDILVLLAPSSSAGDTP